MFESKISTVRSAWGQASSLNTSNAPGFIPIPCPTHTQYSVTNICKTPNCIEPLCPQCIPDHVQLHQQTKKPAKIQNIITTRLACIQQLARMKYQAEKQLQNAVKESSGNIKEFIQLHERNLDTAHKKVQKMVDELFSNFHRQMEIISNAFYAQKQKKQREAKLKMSPLKQFSAKIKQYKEELESNDYIPALIQLLNEPPRKPKLQVVSKIENYGSVQINEKYFEDIKATIQKFVKVNINVKDTGKVNLHSSNYKNSNNLKFSRADRSRSNSRDARDSSLNGSRRSNSKNRIFKGSQSIISQLGTSSANNFYQPAREEVRRPTSQLRNCKFINKEAPLKILKNSYFTGYHEAKLISFQENQRYYYRASLDYVQAGFTKVDLMIDFNLPKNSQTIILPSSEVLLIGGLIGDKNGSSFKASSTTYQLVDDQKLVPVQSMRQPRSNFAACFYQMAIYVFGGLINCSQSYMYDKTIPTKNCQMFDLNTGVWKSISPLPQPAYDFSVCPLQNKIIKFGGRLQSNHFLNRIDIYQPQNGMWTLIEPDNHFLMTVNHGVTAVSNNSLVIFGGFDPLRNQKISNSYLIEVNSQNSIVINPTKQLYHEASFENAYIFKNSILAIQEGEDRRSKVIMGYRHDQWKFISC